MMRVISLVILIALVGIWLDMYWLAYMAGLVGLIFAYMLRPKKIPKGAAVPKPEVKDTIYPVIYEDVGEPPLLYPEKQIVKIIPRQNPNDSWEEAVRTMGVLGGMGISLLTGRYKKSGKK